MLADISRAPGHYPGALFVPVWPGEHDTGTSCHPENPRPLRGGSEGMPVRRTEDTRCHKQRCEDSIERDRAYASRLGMIGSDKSTDLISGVLGGREMPPADYIQVMAERIVRDYDPVKIILFGSHARGEAGPESDIDLLVVLPEVANKRQAAVAIRRAFTDLPVPKDIVVTTPEEIARRGDVVGTVLRPALREGKVLYERS